MNNVFKYFVAKSKLIIKKIISSFAINREIIKNKNDYYCIIYEIFFHSIF